jgi:hypothetical protein
METFPRKDRRVGRQRCDDPRRRSARGCFAGHRLAGAFRQPRHVARSPHPRQRCGGSARLPPEFAGALAAADPYQCHRLAGLRRPEPVLCRRRPRSRAGRARRGLRDAARQCERERGSAGPLHRDVPQSARRRRRSGTAGSRIGQSAGARRQRAAGGVRRPHGYRLRRAERDHRQSYRHDRSRGAPGRRRPSASSGGRRPSRPDASVTRPSSRRSRPMDSTWTTP